MPLDDDAEPKELIAKLPVQQQPQSESRARKLGNAKMKRIAENEFGA